jgi:hypothetical protein
MQITRYGFHVDDAAVQSAREEFARSRCAVLKQFLRPDLARGFARQAEASPSEQMIHRRSNGEEFSRDLTIAANTGVYHGLHLLLNDLRLFSAVREIARTGPIGCFKGRVYKIVPSAGHHLDWHEDTVQPERMLGLSITLSDNCFEGGIFRIRRKMTHEFLAEVIHTEAGGAHLFDIGRDVEHCVTPVLAGAPRLAFAGWFLSSPDRISLIRRCLGRTSPAGF